MTSDGVALDARLAGAIARWVAGERFNVSALCREVGVSRESFYRYARRFRAEGVEGFFPRSRAPLTFPRATPAWLEDEIIRVRKELDGRGECGDNGAISIRWRLLDEGIEPVPSVSTINRVLKRRGQVKPQPAKRPRASSRRRFEAAAPNDLWHFDGLEYLMGNQDIAHILQVGDDCSRLDLADLAACSENSDDACQVVETAIGRYGVPARFLSDNASAFNGHRRGFSSALEDMLRALGTTPISITPGNARCNGKNERGHGTLQRWLARQPLAHDLTELQDLLDTYRRWYNNRRHQSLGGLTPQQRWDLRPKPRPDGTPVPPPPLVTTHTVSPRGTIGVDGHEIALAKKHARRRATAFRTGDHVVVIIDRTVVRDFVLDRTRDYQPSGINPRTGRPRSQPNPPASGAGVKVERPQRSADERP